MKTMLRSCGIDQSALTRELEEFMAFRRRLIGLFGVENNATANAAIHLYRLETFHDDLVQVHVGRAAPGDTTAPSFLISPRAHNTLLEKGRFYRWRYPSVEEPAGQYSNPQAIRVLMAWGEDNNFNSRASAVLFSTATEIAGRLDSEAVLMALRDRQGRWQLFRAYNLDCSPLGLAWGLGNSPLTPSVLPGVAKLKPPMDDVRELFERHAEMRSGNGPDAFKYGISEVCGVQELVKYLGQYEFEDPEAPEAVAKSLDSLLCHE